MRRLLRFRATGFVVLVNLLVFLLPALLFVVIALLLFRCWLADRRRGTNVGRPRLRRRLLGLWRRTLLRLRSAAVASACGRRVRRRWIYISARPIHVAIGRRISGLVRGPIRRAAGRAGRCIIAMEALR